MSLLVIRTLDYDLKSAVLSAGRGKTYDTF